MKGLIELTRRIQSTASLRLARLPEKPNVPKSELPMPPPPRNSSGLIFKIKASNSLGIFKKNYKN